MDPPPVTTAASDRLARLARLGASLRVEDWLLVGWIGVVALPLLRFDGSAGPFDPGRPAEGALQLVGVLGALVCLVTGRSDAPAGAGGGIVGRGAIGPLVGGLLLVSLSGWTGVGLSGAPASAAWIGAVILVIAIRIRWPALPTAVRRALVTPFILATGGIFWSIIDTVTSGRDAPGGAPAATDLQGIALAYGFLVAFSGVYYLMLIYAPRQVAEAEGGPLTWFVRYGLFLASVIIGIAWLRPLGV